ncbi:MFS transporter [Actinomycetospora sp. TBRC 11914]|uniref:MFS transporter n=1 Tax=Actinomycetospora sp. TBRC 11914 TaxID=2729387 RepID=UPI00145E4737|nr:MFS transporter [Actinomycetospora sp. TBRC 11914]NMO92901.1 MFS transporter [Actinomycetospora sp. TBRC 11914]
MTATLHARETRATGTRASAWLPVGLALFTVAWGGNQFTPLMVMYRELGGFSTAVVDVLLGAYVLGIVPGMLVGGPLSDRLGRKPLMLAAPPIAIVGSLVLAVGGDLVPVLFLGRVLAGLALGIGMAVGSTWISELSARHGDTAGGASRAAMSLTLGFLLGPVAAGLLAQWAPWPEVLSYAVHVVVGIPLGLLALRTAETLDRGAAPTRRLRDDLRIPLGEHREFRTVIAPVAPWVFTCAGVAYAVLPSLVAKAVPGGAIAFAAVMTAVTLVAGFAAQTAAKRLRLTDARGGMLGQAFAAAGMALAAVTAASPGVVLALVSATVLGVGYGFALVSGLAEVQRIAPPRHLAGLTAVFYALAYLGFVVPTVLALLAPVVSYTVLFAALGVVALACLAVVARARRGG